ncbi:hypothetical protein BH20ACT5_BH20ACT5_07550 [soil metagenome]
MAPAARWSLSEKLPSAAAFAACELIRGPLCERPYVVGTPLRGPHEGRWRARRGEYRIFYGIVEDSREVHVLDIEHRGDAYRS